MAFTISPKEAPSRVEGVLNPSTPAQQTAKERAMARFMGENPDAPKAPAQGQAQTHPVKDPTHVGIEELSALQVPTQSTTDEKGHNSSTESPAETVEAPQTLQKTPEEGQPLSSQFAQLARKEKALRAREIEIKRMEQEYKAQQSAKSTQPAVDTSRYIDRAELEKNPFGVLAELGLSYESLTEQAANAPTADQVAFNKTISALQAEIKSLKDGQDDFKKLAAEQEQNSYKTAIATIRRDVQELVSEGDAFETVKLSGSEGDVVELIEKTFHYGMGDKYPKGTVLSAERAAQIVEDHLVEEAYNLVNKSTKLKSRLQSKPPVSEAPAKPVASDSKQPPQLRTLTNATSSSRQYTARERAMFAAQHGPNWREKVGA